MKRTTILKLALSAAIVAVPTTGCAGFASKQSAVSKTADAGQKKAAKWAAKADKYMASGDIDKAVENAEKAVEADFRNSAYRSTLARGYIAQGRFVSAERTLQDVLDLGQQDPRTIVSLALLRTAQGKTASAISMLDSYRDILPAGDYGLALAVAGDNERAVKTLEDGVRNENTAQLRQNLALAYALNGQWRESRVTAGQDLTGTQVSENVAKWAQYARPNAYQERVAGLLGVTPKKDIGQPVRLALNSRINPNVDLAANIPQNSSSDIGELPAVGPSPVSSKIAAKASASGQTSLVDKIFGAQEDDVTIKATVKSTPVPASIPAPLIKAPAGPSKVSVDKPASRFIIENAKPAVKPAAKPTKLAIANTAPRKTAARQLAGGSYIVQLGAFSSANNAQKAWSQLTNTYSVLKPFQSTSLVVNANGRQLYRLAAMGFGNQEAANSVCDSIKANGGSCIVRKSESSAPTRLASR